MRSFYLKYLFTQCIENVVYHHMHHHLNMKWTLLRLWSHCTAGARAAVWSWSYWIRFHHSGLRCKGYFIVLLTLKKIHCINAIQSVCDVCVDISHLSSFSHFFHLHSLLCLIFFISVPSFPFLYNLPLPHSSIGREREWDHRVHLPSFGLPPSPSTIMHCRNQLCVCQSSPSTPRAASSFVSITHSTIFITTSIHLLCFHLTLHHQLHWLLISLSFSAASEAVSHPRILQPPPSSNVLHQSVKHLQLTSMSLSLS